LIEFNQNPIKNQHLKERNLLTIRILSVYKDQLLKVDNCPGMDAMGYDFDTGVRIQESYAKLGKALSAYILKQK